MAGSEEPEPVIEAEEEERTETDPAPAIPALAEAIASGTSGNGVADNAGEQKAPEVDGAADATTDEQFLAILAQILKQLPPDPAVQDPLRSGMIRHWLTPPVGHMRLMLGDESITLLDARRCIFYPTPEDMRLRYPRMILSPPAGLELTEQHPQRKIQAPALTLLYF
eukprot:EG_transcript_36610